LKFLDALLGRTKPKQANLDALFAIPNAAVSLEAAAGLKPAGSAAVCFRPASGQDFTGTEGEIAELLALSGQESGATVSQSQDSYGYHWIVVRDPDLSDVVTAVHMVNATLAERGFGPQLLASVFPFRTDDGRVAHLVYLFKRGTFYPFAPTGPERRDNELELTVRGSVTGELPIEEDLTRWFPIWGAPVP